jgi:hypothetical protein
MEPVEPQIHITPLSTATEFQIGHLGAEGERAALEGEVMIKGALGGNWDSM